MEKWIEKTHILGQFSVMCTGTLCTLYRYTLCSCHFLANVYRYTLGVYRYTLFLVFPVSTSVCILAITYSFLIRFE